MKDVKKRHLKERAAKKIKEEKIKKEVKEIQEIAEKQKSNWREELINEGEWQPVASTAPTNVKHKIMVILMVDPQCQILKQDNK